MNIGCVYSLEDFVTVATPLPTQSSIPFGISYIATILKESGHDVEMLVFTPSTPQQETLREFIVRFNPKLFCLTAVSSQFEVICNIAEEIKRIDSTIYIVVGGCHPSLNPDGAITHKAIDAICIGEGDREIVELVSMVEKSETPKSIANFWVKMSAPANTVLKGSQNNFNEDLDSLPFIDRKLWIPWVKEPNEMPSILIARGCPFRCTYCSNHKLSRLSEGKYLRFRSPGSVINEIQFIVKNFPHVKEIFFEVETLGANINYLFDLCSVLEAFIEESGHDISFGLNLAVTKLIIKNLNRIFQAFKCSNISFINIGLESGSERVRKDILRRPLYANTDIIEFCRLAEERSINITLFVLMGVPGETLSDFKLTKEIVRVCQPKRVYLSIYYPYVGTDLYEKTVEMKLFDKEKLKGASERKVAYLNLPEFSKFQIKREYILFYYNVYKGRWSWSKIIVNTCRTIVGISPALNSIYRIVLGNNKFFRILKKHFQSS